MDRTKAEWRQKAYLGCYNSGEGLTYCGDSVLEEDMRVLREILVREWK